MQSHLFVIKYLCISYTIFYFSGLELPPPVTSNTQEAAFNEIPDVAPVHQKQFSNFQPNNNRVKVVNGRRALIKKVKTLCRDLKDVSVKHCMSPLNMLDILHQLQ